ncbi:Sodium/hydrogen exchanger family-domain-containing protein [Dunaliella salina]|uniref:Sodium/hydrogen exchanger family-domain-containing protein n=1 Tax=Dunaliella salina TaxID=3046 RepID=A0ABQ7G5M3_DUNSA|nr:Sodium/hydrogen exchanger family-domain-containing protein [Dunaliella salina]|eukprot:KAF5829912.1 Sodium/hydrogen exchanger family-domain-containing protein [Dunaliella salina]
MAESLDIPLVELFLLGLFGVVLLLGNYFKKTSLETFIGAPTIGICLGIAFSAITVYGGATEGYKKVLSFEPDIFLYVLLPTIIIDASLNVNAHLLLLNFGTICNTAFIGTTGATFIIGVMQWAFGQANIAYKMPFLHNLLLGSVISATDPVSVLAVFQALEADGNLFIIVFGESVINDAVAEVLFETISDFLDYEGHTAVPVNAREVWRAIGIFIGIFLGSITMGLAFGLVNAGIMRSGHFRSQGSAYETGFVIVFLYASYFSATVAHLSGIVTVFFCGLIVRAYTWPNICSEARLLIHSTFELIASLLDIFLFVYIGITVFTLEIFSIWRFAALCLISIAAGRLAGILCSVAVPNLLRPPQRRIGPKVVFLMWWSGLRGAMAFALASLAADRFHEKGKVMKTCVFYVAFLTVVFNGGTIGWLLQVTKMTEADRLAGLDKKSALSQVEEEPTEAQSEADDELGEGPPPTPPTPQAHATHTFFNPLEFHPPPSSAPRPANGYGRLGVHSLPLSRIQRSSQPHVPPPRPPRPLAAPSYSPWEQEHRIHTPLEAHSYKPWEHDIERLSWPVRSVLVQNPLLPA